MGKQSRLNIGGKRTARGNTRKRRKKPANTLQTRDRSPRKLAGAGQLIVRTVMLSLVLSLVAVLGVGLLYGYRYITAHPYFDLKDIRVAGNHRLSYETILDTAKVELGLNCLDMNVGEVKNRLSANPWVDSVTVRRELPQPAADQSARKGPGLLDPPGRRPVLRGRRRTCHRAHAPGRAGLLPVLSVAEDLPEGPEVLAGILKKMADRQTPFTQTQAAWVKLTSAHELEIYLDGAWQRQRADRKTVHGPLGGPAGTAQGGLARPHAPQRIRQRGHHRGQRRQDLDTEAQRSRSGLAQKHISQGTTEESVWLETIS